MNQKNQSKYQNQSRQTTTHIRTLLRANAQHARVDDRYYYFVSSFKFRARAKIVRYTRTQASFDRILKIAIPEVIFYLMVCPTRAIQVLCSFQMPGTYNNACIFSEETFKITLVRGKMTMRPPPEPRESPVGAVVDRGMARQLCRNPRE